MYVVAKSSKSIEEGCFIAPIGYIPYDWDNHNDQDDQDY